MSETDPDDPGNDLLRSLALLRRSQAEEAEGLGSAADAGEENPYRPLDEAEMGGIADFLMALPGGAAEPTPKAAPEPPGNVLKFPAKAAVPAPVSTQRTGGRRLLLWAAPLAAAAVVGAAVLLPKTPSPASPSSLPGYALSARAFGAQDLRGEPVKPAEVLRFTAGDRFDFVLRPAQAVPGGAVEAAFYIARGDAVSPWSPPVERDPSGALRVTGAVGPAGALQGPPGPATLVFVLAGPGALPAAPEVASAVKAGAAAGPYLLLVQPVVLP